MFTTNAASVRRALGLAAIAASLGTMAMPAAAGTTTGTFAITATVINACLITSTSNVAFATGYDPTSSTVNQAQGSVTLICTNGQVAETLLLNGGQHASSLQRYMKDTVSTDPLLAYNLYQPSTPTTCAYATAWGDGGTTATGAGYAIPATTSISPQTYDVCAQLPLNQNVRANTTYTDTVTATINF